MNHSFTNIVFAANESRRCFYCNTGIEGDVIAFATVDHLWPDSKFGSNRPANLIAACHSCNAKRGNLIPEEFRLSYEQCEKIKKKETQPPDWMIIDPLGNLLIQKGHYRERFKKLLFCLVNDLTAGHAGNRRKSIEDLRAGLLTRQPYSDLLNE